VVLYKSFDIACFVSIDNCKNVNLAFNLAKRIALSSGESLTNTSNVYCQVDKRNRSSQYRAIVISKVRPELQFVQLFAD